MHGVSAGEATVPISSLGGLVTLAVPESLPEGASPRTFNSDFNVGNAKTRDGLTRVYSSSMASVGPNNGGTAASSTWNNPSALLSSSGYASFSPASAANSVDVTQFSFALPASDSLAGIMVQATGYANAPATLQAQLISNGIVLATKTIAIPSVAGAITFGSPTDLWGTAWTVASVNAVTFGVRLALLVSGGFTSAGAFVQNVGITIGVNTGLQTMQPLTTFTNQNGMRYNLVVDQGGNLWVESLDTAPNALTLSRGGIAPGSDRPAKRRSRPAHDSFPRLWTRENPLFGDRSCAAVSKEGAEIVLAAHPNLAVVSSYMRRVSPHLQTIVMAHGIEVWTPLTFLRRQALEQVQSVLAPSSDTIHNSSTRRGPCGEDSQATLAYKPWLPRPSRGVGHLILAEGVPLKKARPCHPDSGPLGSRLMI